MLAFIIINNIKRSCGIISGGKAAHLKPWKSSCLLEKRWWWLVWKLDLWKLVFIFYLLIYLIWEYKPPTTQKRKTLFHLSQNPFFPSTLRHGALRMLGKYMRTYWVCKMGPCRLCWPSQPSQSLPGTWLLGCDFSSSSSSLGKGLKELKAVVHCPW